MTLIENIKYLLGLDAEQAAKSQLRLERRTIGLDSGPRQARRGYSSEHRHVSRRQARNRQSQMKKATRRFRNKQFTAWNNKQNGIGMARVWFNPDLIGTPIWNNVREGLRASARTLSREEGVSYETAFYNIEQKLQELYDEVTVS